MCLQLAHRNRQRLLTSRVLLALPSSALASTRTPPAVTLVSPRSSAPACQLSPSQPGPRVQTPSSPWIATATTRTTASTSAITNYDDHDQESSREHPRSLPAYWTINLDTPTERPNRSVSTSNRYRTSCPAHLYLSSRKRVGSSRRQCRASLTRSGRATMPQVRCAASCRARCRSSLTDTSPVPQASAFFSASCSRESSRTARSS